MRGEIQELAGLDRTRTLLAHISAILGWDQETYMPDAAVEERSDQLALVEGLAHDRAVDPRIGELLAAAEASAAEAAGNSDPLESAYLRVLRREYDRETRLPASLVVELAKATSVSQAAWAKARADSDFAAFEPHLEHMVELARAKAACLGPGKRPYDVLLDLYENGSTESSIAGVFGALRADLVGILGKIRARPQVDDSFLHRRVDRKSQEEISAFVLEALGYDSSRGRLDVAAHPFTTTLGASDVRITTRYEEDYFPSSVFSTIHEAGHALYELGIAPGEGYGGTRLSEAASMAVHESQSRMLENMIGRSAGFWKPLYPKLQARAGASLEGISLDRFIRGINRVEPGLVRVEADEVTYALHVILRFEIEADLISGNLAVKDLPGAWNRKAKELLGVEVPDDRLGCLQDIHWSMGAFGYFPSYALGNLYAAQFMTAMRRDMPGMDDEISRGELGPTLGWLRANVHRSGATHLPGELVLRATGSCLDPSHYVRYLEDKYSAIYGY